MLSEILTLIITFIAGGGLITLITLPSIRSKARADAMKSVQDVYQETINDLREEKKRQKEDLTAQMDELLKKIEKLEREIDSLKKLKCYDLSCANRIKHQ